jgi:hypothetical protein
VSEAYRTYPDGRQVCTDTTAGKHEYHRRLTEMYERQDGLCAICGCWMAPEQATFEHEAGRGSGGGHRDDRSEVDGHWQNAALDWGCNVAKGSRRYHWQDGFFVPAK